MGCYGIGVTRVVAAAIEQNHDARGIVWPQPIAPFAVAIAPVGYERSEAVRALADPLHAELEAAGVEVLLDDRGERPGVMFADLELIGIPHRITIGERGLKEGKVEYQARRDAAATAVAVGDIAAFIRDGSRRMTTGTRRRNDVGAATRACSWRWRAAPCALAGAQAEEGLAPSVVTGLRARSPTIRSRPTARQPELAQWLGAMSERLAPRSPIAARATNSSQPCTTRRCAPGSIRNWCSP